MSRTWRRVSWSSYWYDVAGALDAGQDGMAVASAKNAVWDGASLWLLLRRAVYQKPAPGPALRALFAETAGDALLSELDRLLLANPRDHDEVVAFAHDCLDFAAVRLDLQRWRDHYGSLTTPESYGRYHQRILDLARLAEELGILLPRSAQAVTEGIRIRTEVQRLVAAEAAATD